jgi:hypothetical protein
MTVADDSPIRLPTESRHKGAEKGFGANNGGAGETFGSGQLPESGPGTDSAMGPPGTAKGYSNRGYTERLQTVGMHLTRSFPFCSACVNFRFSYNTQVFRWLLPMPGVTLTSATMMMMLSHSLPSATSATR